MVAEHSPTMESLWIDTENVLHKTDSATKGMPQSNSPELVLRSEEVLAFLNRMPRPFSVENFTWVLQKCRKKKNLAHIRLLYACMCTIGLEADSSLGNYLVPMLVEVHSMCDAQQVFSRLDYRNEYSWSSLIAGYIEWGESQLAFNLYQKMQEENVHPSGYTFVALLKACTRLQDAERGGQIHTEIARNGLESDLFVGNTLVSMYAKCGLLPKAQEVFDKLQVRDAVSWTALIAAYAEHGLGEEALCSFEQMLLEGVSPNVVTFICSLKACSSVGAIDKGLEIHAEIAQKGLLESNVFVGNALVDMYAKCGLLAKAHEVFDKLPVRTVVSWTALIAGYAKHGHGQEALNFFERMQLEGVLPDALTSVCSLKACGCIGDLDKGQEIHAEIARKGFLERDPCVGNALVDMYAKCGSLAKAQEVFDKLPVRDVVSWTALIAAYSECGLGEEALHCFEQMQLNGIAPNAVTFVCSLKACSSIGAIDKGQEIHVEIARKGLERNTLVGSTLVDMYAKCGLPAKAWEAFDKLPVRDVVSWTALIVGYSHSGESDYVFSMLERMRREGIKPNGVTFLSVLAVCSHTGLVDKGQKYFEAMSKDYGIIPTIEHLACLVDLLGRAGQLDEAEGMMKKMPFHPNLAVWHTVLGACLKWGNVELGRQAFEHAVQLDEKDATAYVLMSNIYADADMHEDEKKVDAMRVNAHACEKPGQSWCIDVGRIMHSFLVGETRHSSSKNIHAKVVSFCQNANSRGVLDLHWASKDMFVDAGWVTRTP